jgi:chromosomal replication initiation ATPase DnaA
VHTRESRDRFGWFAVKDHLATLLGDTGQAIVASWFSRATVETIADGVVTIVVPIRFHKSRIEAEYGDKLLSAWRAADPGIQRIAIVVRSPESKRSIDEGRVERDAS